jgi:asparagine synthase (glutamine-hydrolysing)
MCGIAGILSLSPEARVENAALRTMADQLRHRGPDDAGFYLDPQARCGFAFRRLSIIDLKTATSR